MKNAALLLYAWCFDLYRRMVFHFPILMPLIFLPQSNRIRRFNGKARAYARLVMARKRVPAYRDFLQKKGFLSATSFSQIPGTDKENYVKMYEIAERCKDGKIPSRGIVIDESSGSSGTATNWVRGNGERKRNAKMIEFGIRRLFGKEPLFIINAFALGPWATGVNITMSCVGFSMLKSLGPDKGKIENTLRQFGPKYKYLIMGYPPFLKMLVEQSPIDWKAYNVSLIFGGESMSENMRDYLLDKGIRKVYSSFGASDLELNISAENDFTISVRRLLRSNEALRKRVLQFGGALPMVFQYHPADFLIEPSPTGELVITICRTGYLSPKIRYNIHDRGHVMELKNFFSLLAEMNIDRSQLALPPTNLPLLFHYGRADMAVSFFGANISPVDVHEAISLLPELMPVIASFCLSTPEDESGDKRLVVHLELAARISEKEYAPATHEKAFYAALEKINQDFREASRMANKEGQKTIVFHAFGQGPFVDSDIRIKAKYIT